MTQSFAQFERKLDGVISDLKGEPRAHEGCGYLAADLPDGDGLFCSKCGWFRVDAP